MIDTTNATDGAGRAFTPELVDVESVSSGWINKYVLTYRLEDGSLYQYETTSRKGSEAFRAALEMRGEGRASRPDAVCIVPVLPDDSLLLIREFRYPLNAWCIAFPAGLLEEGEDLKACAARELREEVGCRLSTEWGDDAVTALPQAGYSSTGLTDENVQVVFARVERDAAPEPERGELIEQFTLRFDDVERFLAENRDLIGTRAQLILEMIRRGWAQRRRQPAPQEPLTRQDYA